MAGRSSMRRALISVSDKSGVLELARAFLTFDIEILSTGGTAAMLRAGGIPVTDISAYTGFPEMLDGRVKTLHPKVHGGILARRDSADHVRAIEAAGIAAIDIVVVNLYPFRQTIARSDCTLDEAIENIDIGGPAMVRAAAKNYAHVTVVTDPADYARLIEEMAAGNGEVSVASRFDLARKAFSHTAAYDSAISNYLTALDAHGARSVFPERLNFNFAKMQDLRYGENPHQQAALYRDPTP